MSWQGLILMWLILWWTKPKVILLVSFTAQTISVTNPLLLVNGSVHVKWQTLQHVVTVVRVGGKSCLYFSHYCDLLVSYKLLDWYNGIIKLSRNKILLIYFFMRKKELFLIFAVSHCKYYVYKLFIGPCRIIGFYR